METVHDVMQVLVAAVFELTAQENENTFHDKLELLEGVTEGVSAMQDMEELARTMVRRLRIPEEVEHGIRRKWNSESGGSGTAIPGSGTRIPGSGTANPEEVEQRFRRS